MNYRKGQVQHKRHIDDIYNKDKKIAAEKRFIGHMFYMMEDDALQTVFIRSKHPFLYSFSYLTIKNYPISQLFSRMNNYSSYFFQRMVIEYDKYNLHHKFKYRSKVDKRELRNDLVNGKINDNVIQFITDYFDMNIVINDVNTGILRFYLSRGEFDVYKPMILMYKNKERHYPLILNKHMILKSDVRLKWKLYFYYIRPSIIKFRFPSKLNIKLYSLKIKELQELAKEYDIGIHKVSKNNKKITNKTKDELKLDIKKKLGIKL